LILIAFGTRPEYIKIKPIIEKLNIPYKILFTGQHEDLLQKIISKEKNMLRLSIKPGNNRLDSIVASVMNTESIFEDVTSVLVQGDTTSAFAVALAAFHRRIKVIHLEAGLRTYDKNQPYPEEFNRQAISRIADLHLCPTETSKTFLCQESTQGRIEVVGNTVLDNLRDISSYYSDLVIVTMHRRENHNNIKKWFKAINNIAKENKHINFLMPLHPNPNIQKHKHLLKDVNVVEPMEYSDFINHLAKSKFVITDSGGLQEEASFLGKKCIVCREKTERLEGVGTFAIMCSEPQNIEDIFYRLLEDYSIDEPSPYGDGKSSEKIINILHQEANKGNK
jgi:UDP-N-acetylglucosamine 2-epimerase (non-hydrolysing)|tara:strand:- start:12373 stop:13380 length:1008 start_codon:yes stop_codon:yes gene_type:complete